MDLNEHHYQNIVSYLKFARYRRAQQIRSVDGNFEDFIESKVREDETYNGDEVEDILKELQDIVHCDVETELLDNNHTNCLLLRQLFRQAEKWHLKLYTDTSELEDKNLLDEVAKLEEAGSNHSIRLDNKTKLKPLQESGPVPLLQMEISRLEEENNMLRSRLEKMEMDVSNALEDKGNLKREVEVLQCKMNSTNNRPDEEVARLSNEIDNLNLEIRTLQASSKGTGVPEDYISTKHQLLAVQSELEQTQHELDKKFSETRQYKNLKQMLVKKNDQIKELRGRLRKYEPSDD